ncbi:Kdo hydroxylase family protein [Lichenibacterium minor]|nr:Kdo hydroxylase family protein [Lichenibacterium minor]
MSNAAAAPAMRATSVCVPVALDDWHGTPDAAMKRDAVDGLERGDVVLLPNLPFALSPAEAALLDPSSVKQGTKTVKYDPDTGRVWGYAEGVDAAAVKSMMARYADYTRRLLDALIPTYGAALKIGNTSFRPVEAQGRDQSKRHDDTLLHVDAFPSRPSHGQRIMRVFTNVHPGAKPRVWRVGEPFETVAERFLPKIAAPIPGSAKLMKLVGITKSQRSAADHYMLQLHDRMKLDDEYQRTVPHRTVEFAPGSTWMVFTDQVSHAAMSGQHALEQTFTLEVDGMAHPEHAPVRVLERMKGKKLR